jgi:transposase InsO family protein
MIQPSVVASDGRKKAIQNMNSRPYHQRWRKRYNEKRPHSSLGYRPPR